MNDTTVTAAFSQTWFNVTRRPAWPSAFKSPLIIALAAYLALALILLPGYTAFAGKDEIASVAAAERYARGEFSTGPNSLWGPLVSWLIALGISLGASSIVAARAVGIISGAATLWAVRRLAKTLQLPDGLQLVFLLTLVPYVVHYALFGVNDDLPLTALLTFYFATVFDPQYPRRRYAGALCGLLGGFSYYAKGFAFGFFLIHFTVSNAAHWIAHRNSEVRRKVARHFATGIAIFAALAAIWVAALYQKYHVVTLGITGAYNYQIRGPEALGRPTEFIGFVAPPPATSVNIWEDPAYFYDLPQARACCLKPWSPLDSGTAFRHQLNLFRLNLGRTLMVFVTYSPFTLAVGFAALCYCFAPFWPARRRKQAAPPPPEKARGRLDPLLTDLRDALVKRGRLVPAMCLLTILIYPIPYTLVFSDERFFWPILILFMGLGLYLLEIFSREYAVSRTARGWLVGVFAASFLIYPVYKLTTGQKARHAITSMVQQAEASHLSGAPFASNTDYTTSMVIGYYIKGKYYGTAAPGMSDEEISEDLRRKGVQYYFVWAPLPARPVPPAALPGMTLTRILKADFRQLSIYRVNS